MSFQEVVNGFVQQYYNFFSTQRPLLAGVYRPSSLMTWQSEQMQGGESIMARFANLAFTESQFKTDSIDCQPTASGGVLVVVNGEVMLKDERHPLKFNDLFHLVSDEAGQWYVANQIFNIIGGGGQ